MKKLLTMLLAMGVTGIASAQLVNNGGTIVIESNATLVVESDVTNNTSGTITNNGVLEVKGDLTSVSGSTFTSGASSSVKFSGANPSEINLPAGTVLQDLEMAKSSNDLTLASDIELAGDLTFSNNANHIVIGANDLVLGGTSAAVTGATTDAFVVTNGEGVMQKKSLSGTFTFPVGNSTTAQNDLALTEAGTSDDISVRVLADAYDDPTGPTGAMTEDAVAATWEVTEATAGGSDLTVAPSWATPGDELTDFDQSMAAVYAYESGDYNGLAAPAAATVSSGVATVSNSGYTNLDGTKYFIVSDDKYAAATLAVKAFLQGPYNAGTGMMNELLRTKNLIPLTEPYTAMAAFTHVGEGGGESVSALADLDYPDAGNDVVDWVFVEIQDASDVTVQTKAALIQRDGDIVDTDGNPLKFSTLSSGDYSIIVRHRNHLGVKSSAPQTFTKGALTTFDFTSAATQAVGDQQASVGGTFAIYGGNANGDSGIPTANKTIRMTGPSSINDITTILAELGGVFTNSQINVYKVEDINMDGNLRMTGPSSINDATQLLTILGGVFTNTITRSF